MLVDLDTVYVIFEGQGHSSRSHAEKCCQNGQCDLTSEVLSGLHVVRAATVADELG